MALGSIYTGAASTRIGSGAMSVAGLAGSGSSTDLQLLIVGQKPATANGGGATTPSGWSLVGSFTGLGGYGGTTGANVGNVNCLIYRKTTTANASETITLADTSVAWGMQVRIATGGGLLDLAYTTGEDVSGDASLSFAGTANPGIKQGDLVLAAQVIASAVPGIGSEGMTATGATLGANLATQTASSSGGNSIAGTVYGKSVTAGTATVAPTATATASGTTTNARGGALILRIRETIRGAFNGTLGAVTASGAGSAPTTATGLITLEPLTATSAAVVPALGQIAITLGGVFAEATAIAAASAGLAQTVGPVSADGAGTSVVAGAATGSVGPISLTATATSWKRAPLDRRAAAIGGVRTRAAIGGSRSAAAIG